MGWVVEAAPPVGASELSRAAGVQVCFESNGLKWMERTWSNLERTTVAAD